jgi:hypothetical protein
MSVVGDDDCDDVRDGLVVARSWLECALVSSRGSVRRSRLSHFNQHRAHDVADAGVGRGFDPWTRSHRSRVARGVIPSLEPGSAREYPLE